MIGIAIFGAERGPYDDNCVRALIAGRELLTEAAAATLRANASFSERYLSERRCGQIAEQMGHTLCEALDPAARAAATERFEQAGLDLATAGLLREAIAALGVALTDSALAIVATAAPATDTGLWLQSVSQLMVRAIAALNAGFVEGRRLYILEQQEGMRRAITTTLADREAAERRLLDIVAEMSTPVVPLLAGIMVMPIVGVIDSRRAGQITEQMLTSIESARAHTMIIDITGVGVVDTQTAAVLIRAAQAARLLGAQVLLVGITPEVAQTIVGLGVEMQGLRTFADLQAGVVFSLRQAGYALTKV